MRYEETLEDLLEAIQDLKEENEGTAVIVEGEKDAAALGSLGLEGEVLMVNSGMSLFSFCEHVSRRHKSVIVLTDWDARGGTLCRRLREGLEANGVKPHIEYRQRIAVLCRKDVKDVEGLPKYISTLEKWTRVSRREGAARRTAMSVARAASSRARRP